MLDTHYDCVQLEAKESVLCVNSFVETGTIVKISTALATKTYKEIENALSTVNTALVLARINQDEGKISALLRRRSKYTDVSDKRLSTLSLLLQLAKTMEADLMESHGHLW